MDLFDYMLEQNKEKESPLASRLRPATLEEVVGQQHIIGKDKLLYRAIKADKLSSIIFYGPPGTGKTQTILNIIANIILQGKTVQIVSNNNAGTSVNSIFTSGCIIPDNTFFAISTPFDLIPLKLIPFEAHTIKSNINNTVRDLLIHVFGCFSNCFFIDISILP